MVGFGVGFSTRHCKTETSRWNSLEGALKKNTLRKSAIKGCKCILCWQGIYGGIVKRDESGEIVIGRQYRESHSCNDQPCHVQKVFGVPIFLKHGSQLTPHCRVGMNWLHNGHVECSWVKTITYDQNKNGCVRNIRTPRPFEDRGLWSWIRSIDITRAMHNSGRQYQNHNPRPGPIYAGGGYTPINEAPQKLQHRGCQGLK